MLGFIPATRAWARWMCDAWGTVMAHAIMALTWSV